MEALSVEQAHNVGAYLATHHAYFGDLYRLIFLAGCNLGLRAYDLLHIRVGLLDAGEGDITEQKTKKIRHLVINDTLRRLYAEYRTQQGFIFWAPDLFIAESSRGECLETAYLHRLIASACLALGYQGTFGSHTMRKTFASEIYRKTHSVATVQSLLHHTRPATTMVYINDVRATEQDAPTLDYTLSELYNLVSFS